MTSIHLNVTLEQFVYLLEGDENPNLKLEIRANLLQEYAKTYLKPLMQEEGVRDILSSIKVATKRDADRQLESLIAEVTAWDTPNAYKLRPEFLEQVMVGIKATFERELNARLEALNQQALERIEATFATQADKINTYIEKSMQRAITAEVDERIHYGIREALEAAAKHAAEKDG